MTGRRSPEVWIVANDKRLEARVSYVGTNPAGLDEWAVRVPQWANGVEVTYFPVLASVRLDWDEMP